jgi:hypothetical protein
MANILAEHLRCPADLVAYRVPDELSGNAGFFRFGGAICYGKSSSGTVAASPSGPLYDVSQDVAGNSQALLVPFDPDVVLDNLRLERYCQQESGHRGPVTLKQLVRNAYYFVRPALPVSVRRHLQRISLRGWQNVTFPQWPVDCTVERIHEELLARLHQSANGIPFLWFWPKGASACAIVTHDVETAVGRDFCAILMDLNESYGIKSSFQVIPEKRYEVAPSFLAGIRSRRFEVNVHDLNHDGHLFDEREEFLRRAWKINQYIREFGALGFRSGVLYRNLEWYDAFEFSYDMSVPNVAHLDPQRGGCCTVFPYFIGRILELPLTTTQDYSLFHILGDYSIELWKKQIDLVMEKHGLISFNIHPDYIIEKRARSIYEALLHHLADLRSSHRIWFALPKEVDCWWRDRSASCVVREGDTWRIEGPARDRARIAFARLDGERIVYQMETATINRAAGAPAE